MDTRQPVEIELTPAEPRRERRVPRQDGPGGTSPEPSPRRSSPLSSERGRLVAAAGCAGLLALLVGWAAGRATGEEGAAAPVTTAAAERASVDTTVPEPEVIEPPATTRPPTRRTTTTLPAAVLQTLRGFEIDEALAGLPVTIVGVDQTGQYLELDLANEVLELRSLGRRMSGVEIRAGDDWVLILAQDDRRASWLVENDAEPVEVDVGTPWDTYWATGSPIIWRSVPDGVGLRAEAIHPNGEPTGEVLELPGPFAYPQAADPLGGVVISLPGGTYRLSASGAELLTTGQILGMSAELLVAYECDERAECALYVTERATGDFRVLDTDTGGLMPFWGQWSISPDGSQVLVQLVSQVGPNGYEMIGLGLVDLDDGQVTALGSDSAPVFTPASWSPDGRYVFYLGGGPGFGTLMAHDRGTGTDVVVAEALPTLIGFAVKSAPDLSAG